MIKVSVIMPVYNSEKYLRKAVDSILNQDFEGYELILVDDGSPDNSGKICDEYAANNENVKVVHKTNGGICSARNAGLDVAQGEYIGFCDNDDQYLPGLLKDNYEIAKSNNVDLLRYSKIKRMEKDDGRVWETVTKLEDMVIEKKDFYKHYINIRREDTVWTGFYKREIIEKNNIRFNENLKHGGEEVYFNTTMLKYCQRIGFNSKAYYLWTQRDVHSTSRKYHDEFFEDLIGNLQLDYEFIKDVCQNKVPNYAKNVYLVNSYIHALVDYMAVKTCKLSQREKIERLERFRKHPIFDKSIPRETYKKVKKMNYRIYITMRLFDKRRYKALIFIVNNGTKLLDKTRFK